MTDKYRVSECSDGWCVWEGYISVYSSPSISDCLAWITLKDQGMLI